MKRILNVLSVAGLMCVLTKGFFWGGGEDQISGTGEDQRGAGTPVKWTECHRSDHPIRRCGSDRPVAGVRHENGCADRRCGRPGVWRPVFARRSTAYPYVRWNESAASFSRCAAGIPLLYEHPG